MPSKEELGGEFNFQVGQEKEFDFSTDPPEYVPYYVVQLPHSCEEWRIAFYTDKAMAVAQVETFIAEAQTALARLRDLP
jgi:hypothetical protein